MGGYALLGRGRRMAWAAAVLLFWRGSTGLAVLSVSGNALPIPSGDRSPRVADGTEFGLTRVGGAGVTHGFTASCGGENSILITSITAHPDAFLAGGLVTPTELAPGGSLDFGFTLSSTWFRADVTSDVVIQYTVLGVEHTYTFAVHGTLGYQEPLLSCGGTAIPNGGGAPTFAVPVMGHSVTQTFTITNIGEYDLRVNPTGYPGVQIRDDKDGEFDVVEQLAIRTLVPGATTQFRLSYTPNAPEDDSASAWFPHDGLIGRYDFGLGGTAGASDMDVRGADLSIACGDSSPRPEDGTHFGLQWVDGETETHSFVVRNNGDRELLLGAVRFEGPHPGDFEIAQQPIGPVPPGGVTTMLIRFDPSAVGARDAVVTLGNNDPADNPYTFAIRGIGGRPEMDLFGNALPIVSGDKSPRQADGTDFGNVRLDAPATRLYAIRNTGNYLLALTGAPAVQLAGAHAADFMIERVPDDTVASDGATEFRLRFTPNALGARTANVIIPNTDADENPYTFTVAGTGVMPEIAVRGGGLLIADGDASPRTLDGTDFAGVTTHTATTHVFEVWNTGTAELHLDGEPAVTFSGSTAFSLAGLSRTNVPPGESAALQIRFRPTTAGAHTAWMSMPNDDANENPYNFMLQGSGLATDTRVEGNGWLIPHTSASLSTNDNTLFPNTVTTGLVPHTFVIRNAGLGTQILTNTPPVILTGDGAADFSVTVQPAATRLGPGEQTSFDVAFAPRAGGHRRATVEIGLVSPGGAYRFDVGGFAFLMLTNDAPVESTTLPGGFAFRVTDDGWAGVALWPDAAIVDLTTYEQPTFAGVLDTLATGGLQPAFTVFNGRSAVAAATLYARTACTSACAYVVESEWSARPLTVDVLHDDAFESREAFDLYEIYLTAGQPYLISVGQVNGVADVALYLFHKNRELGGSEAYDARADTGGRGAGEQLTYTPNASGWYGVAVLSKEGMTPYAVGVFSDGPRMRVRWGTGPTIASGDMTPDDEDGTTYGIATPGSAGDTRNYSLENMGNRELLLTSSPAVSIGGAHRNDFSVTLNPASTVAPLYATSFRVRFAPLDSGPREAALSLPHNDPLRTPYTFAIRGWGYRMLNDNVPVAFSAAAEYLRGSASSWYWSVTAVRGDSRDVAMTAALTPDGAAPVCTSAVPGVVAEFVATPAGAGVAYLRVDGGAGAFSAEQASCAGLLTLGSPLAVNLAANQVVHARSATLIAGRRYYAAVTPSLGQSADVALFVLPPGGTWTTRGTCALRADSRGAGLSESLTFEAAESGDHAFIVLKDNLPAAQLELVAAEAVPAMAVSGNGRTIADGDTTPTLTDGTGFPDTGTSATNSRIFTVHNTGYADLELEASPRVRITGPDAAHFSVARPPAATVALRGGETTFTVDFHPRRRGALTARVEIDANDPAHPTYDFSIAGYALGPVMEVQGFGHVVPDGSSVPSTTNATDFGMLTPGRERVRTFTIHNRGEASLYLSAAYPVAIDVDGPHAAEFTPDTGPTSVSVAPGASTAFSLAFRPAAPGTRAARLRISCNDPEREPYEFSVCGTAVLPRITRFTRSRDGVELRWESLRDEAYLIRRATSLLNGFTGTLGTVVYGHTPETTQYFNEPAHPREAYYRIDVLP